MEGFSGPVLASHQNCRALVPGRRQFSDDQIRRIIERGGILGVACDAWMLLPDWQKASATSMGTPREQATLDRLVDQIDHVCQLADNRRHVAIGSDLDGRFGSNQTPFGLDSIADLQKLDGLLESCGHAEADRDAIFHANWLNFLQRHLPA